VFPRQDMPVERKLNYLFGVTPWDPEFPFEKLEKFVILNSGLSPNPLVP